MNNPLAMGVSPSKGISESHEVKKKFINRDLLMGGRGRLRVRVFCSEHAHFEKCRPLVGLQTLGACSVRKTRSRSRPHSPI